MRDASFQEDPEHFDFNCLSTEETWNYLDSQAREASRELKVLAAWLQVKVMSTPQKSY